MDNNLGTDIVCVTIALAICLIPGIPGILCLITACNKLIHLLH